jgi:hypothetical protein
MLSKFPLCAMYAGSGYKYCTMGYRVRQSLCSHSKVMICVRRNLVLRAGGLTLWGESDVGIASGRQS